MQIKVSLLTTSNLCWYKKCSSKFMRALQLLYYLGHMLGDKVRAVIIFGVISPGVNFSVAGNARVLEATSSPQRQ